MPLVPVALYGLEVPCGDMLVPAIADFPATFRITMAAIDPSEEPEVDEDSKTVRPRATLKIIRQQIGDDGEDSDDDEYMRALLGDSDSDSEDGMTTDDLLGESSDEEENGGPSDPAKSKKAKKAAAIKELLKSLDEGASDEDEDEDMEDASNDVNGTNGTVAIKKGKAKATEDDEEDSEDEEDSDDDDVEVESFVLCTLDPEKNYQQTLDITIGENESVYFQVSGTHTVYLTGNYVIPDDDGHNHHHEVYDSDEDSDVDSEEDVDLSPDEDELVLDMDDESDDLDALDDPRITEVDSEEEAPKLVEKKAEKKGRNKRTADELDEATSLDDLISKASKPEVAAEEPKLSKKQLKKLKKNNGEAAAVKPEEQKNGVAKDATPAKSDKSDKKVQFAKNLEQGPTGSAEKPKAAESKLGVKKVGGVTIDDKKIGTGAAAKKGDKVGMRYIGKLQDGKVFDSNKSGKPFSFKVGAGEVIKGWDVGIAGMAVGGERRLTIPADLAYGSQKLPGIPPKSTLIFDVKLLEIKR